LTWRAWGDRTAPAGGWKFSVFRPALNASDRSQAIVIQGAARPNPAAPPEIWEYQKTVLAVFDAAGAGR